MKSAIAATKATNAEAMKMPNFNSNSVAGGFDESSFSGA
jgi:hypothetical protein